MAEPPAAGPRRSYQTLLLVVAVTAAGFNLRTAISNLPPLFPDLQTQLHLSPAALSLLAALGLLTVGLLLRGISPGVMLFPGTILASSAIAIMNVLLSSMVKRRKPERAGHLISTYLTALCVGAIIASLLAVPLYQASGGSVRLALGLWAGPAALATLLWLPQLRYRSAGSGPGTGPESGPGNRQSARVKSAHVKVYKYLLAWQVMAFMGLQSLLYYAALSWLPTIFQDRGTSAVTAGNLLALMGAGNLVGALVVPVLAHRTPDQRALVVPSMAAMGVGLAGSLWAPLATAPFWVLVLGLGQGSCLGLAIFFMLARAPDPGSAASLSTFAQSAGYLVASAGPLVLGLLHSATGSWNIPVALLLVLCGLGLGAGLLAARPLVLPGQQTATPVSETGQASRAI